jgi:hypothetical protein
VNKEELQDCRPGPGGHCVKKLPFDVRNWNTLEYTKGQTHKLLDNLVKRLEAVTK